MNRQRQREETPPVPRRPANRTAILTGSTLAVIAGGLVWWKAEWPVTAEATRSVEVATLIKEGKRHLRPSSTEKPRDPVEGPVLETAPTAPEVLSSPSESSRQLVRAVWERAGGAEVMTADQAAAWRRNLETLIKSGSESVAAIAEFLATGTDTVYGLDESALLGFNSAREALLDALSRIGGSEALAIMAGTLGSATTPSEVAMLARNLEILAPGEYREQAIAAATKALSYQSGKSQLGVDVAPLFEVLQQFGGVDVARDLEEAATRWGHYATMSLGALPEGAGVPSLLRLADTEPGRTPNPCRLQALQMIAQLACDNEQARAGLIAFARDEEIPAAMWPYLARPLAGDRARLQNQLLEPASSVPDDNSQAGSVHIVSGNQNLLWVRSSEHQSAAAKGRLIALIKELASVTHDPDALRILNQTRAHIEGQPIQASNR